MGSDLNGSVAVGDARQRNKNAEFQALAYMETRVKAIDLLKRSYAQVIDAEMENAGRDNTVDVRTNKTYDNISQEFARSFGST